MKIRSPLALLLAPLFLVLGCPDENNPTPDAGPDGPDPRLVDLCAAYAIGEANYINTILLGLTRCSAEEEFIIADADQLAEIEASCEPGVEYYDVFATALEGGRVNLDLDKAISCLEKGRAARAQTTIFEYSSGQGPLVALLDDADCLGAITPNQGEGDVCVQAWDCPAEFPCQADPLSATELRCLAPAAEGEACEDQAGIRFCDVDLACVDETCEPLIALNGACDPAGGDAGCVEGTYCSATTNVCTTLGGSGDTCQFDDECGDGLACDPGTSTCQAPPAPIANGQSCDPAADACASFCSVCAPAEAGGALACRDRGAAGAYCEDDDHCRNGFICDPQTSACVVEPVVDGPDLGAACDPDGPACDEGECVEGTCVAGVENDPCDPSFPACQAGLVCDADAADPSKGVCVPAPATGEACIDGQCNGGDFCNAQDQCEALHAAGEACGGDEECVSGTCLNAGVCSATAPSCYSDEGFFVQFILLGLLLPVVRLRRRR